MNKFTKWRVSFPCVLDEQDRAVCEVRTIYSKNSMGGRTVCLGEAEKHAKIIAAAPELLANLEDLVQVLRRGDCGDISPIMDEIFDAEGAIAKAKGEKR